MVRAWAEGGPSSTITRPTVDVDLALLSMRSGGKAVLIPERLRRAGLTSGEEPFRLQGEGGVLIDLLIPPGASRANPPRLGRQIMFEAAGSRFAFELLPEKVEVTLGEQRLEFLTPRLAGALVLKAVVMGRVRRRVRDDAVDVARLLACARTEPDVLSTDLRGAARRGDVREGLRVIGHLFAEESSKGARLVAQQAGPLVAIEAVSDARWLLSRLKN